MNIGRRLGGWGLLMLLCTTLPCQVASPQQQHESVVINIEVPVRVLRKDAFVDGLTLADFEVFENGVRQPVEAVYLIKDKKVLREEKAAGSEPPRRRATTTFCITGLSIIALTAASRRSRSGSRAKASRSPTAWATSRTERLKPPRRSTALGIS